LCAQRVRPIWPRMSKSSRMAGNWYAGATAEVPGNSPRRHERCFSASRGAKRRGSHTSPV